MLVRGETGVGKSRLVSELVARTPGAVRVLAGSCLDQEDASLPFAMFATALRDYIRQAGHDQMGRLLGDVGDEIGALLPEFGTPPATNVDPNLARLRLFGVIGNLFADIAAIAPLVLVLEDIHWADRVSLDLARYLIDRLEHTPVMVLTTYRTDDAKPLASTEAFAATLARMDCCDVVELPRLTL